MHKQNLNEHSQKKFEQQMASSHNEIMGNSSSSNMQLAQHSVMNDTAQTMNSY